MILTKQPLGAPMHELWGWDDGPNAYYSFSMICDSVWTSAVADPVARALNTRLWADLGLPEMGAWGTRLDLRLEQPIGLSFRGFYTRPVSDDTSSVAWDVRLRLYVAEELAQVIHAAE